MGEGLGPLVGKLQHLPSSTLTGTALPFSSGIVLHKQPQGLGRHAKNPAVIWPTCLSKLRTSSRVGSMVSL